MNRQRYGVRRTLQALGVVCGGVAIAAFGPSDLLAPDSPLWMRLVGLLACPFIADCRGYGRETGFSLYVASVLGAAFGLLAIPLALCLPRSPYLDELDRFYDYMRRTTSEGNDREKRR